MRSDRVAFTVCLVNTSLQVDGEVLDDGSYRTLKSPAEIDLLLAEIQDVRDLGLPPLLAPAVPQPDDAERVYDTPVPFEGENFTRVLLTCNKNTQIDAHVTRERLRKQMPRFPSLLKGVEAPGSKIKHH